MRWVDERCNLLEFLVADNKIMSVEEEEDKGIIVFSPQIAYKIIQNYALMAENV